MTKRILVSAALLLLCAGGFAAYRILGHRDRGTMHAERQDVVDGLARRDGSPDVARVIRTSPGEPHQKLPVIPGVSKNTRRAVLGDLVDKVDASQDPGWESETLSEQVSAQLKSLADLLTSNRQSAVERLANLVTSDIECSPLRPRLQSVFDDGSIRVSRAPTGDATASGTVRVRGADEFLGALRSLTEPFDGAGSFRVDSKVVHVQLAGDRADTEVYFHAQGTRRETRVQQNAVWHCRWERRGSEAPKLASLDVTEFEEVTVDSGRMFVDCTDALLGHDPAFREQLVYGVGHWHGNLDVAFGFDNGLQGIALGDVNGDLLDDLYVCQPAGLVNRLFVQQQDGTLRDVSAGSGTDWLDASRSALIIDLDNDGDQDLVVTVDNYLAIQANDGGGKFRLVAKSSMHSDPASLCSADYDGDGDLDVFACGYTGYGQRSAGDSFANPLPYHDANNGGPNLLLQNEGNLRFSPVTEQVGLDVNNRRFSYAAAWEDYDNDGDLDLYVANDFGRNNLYRNEGGTFVDVAAEAGVEDIAAGMSVAWGDYNRDGLMDLYVSNMFSSAGNRISYQRNFRKDSGSDLRRQLQRHARGNTLFENAGDGTFRDRSAEAAVTMGRWAWGSRFVDIDNNGWEDLYVANGFFTSEDTGDL